MRRNFGSGQDAKQQEYRGIPMLSNAAMGQKAELETVKTSAGHLKFLIQAFGRRVAPQRLAMPRPSSVLSLQYAL
ncbi:MAG: hypothetical protein JKY56_23105 [Kofleriaceae bacterium]|nr:hypothetical protein [Kofleriaceae bacterium]